MMQNLSVGTSSRQQPTSMHGASVSFDQNVAHTLGLTFEQSVRK